MTDEDPETISLQEAQEKLADVFPVDGTLSFTDGKIVYEDNNQDFSIEFISVRDNPEVTVKGSNAMATASSYIIRDGDEVYEVETDGPFKIGIPGLGDALDE